MTWGTALNALGSVSPGLGHASVRIGQQSVPMVGDNHDGVHQHVAVSAIQSPKRAGTRPRGVRMTQR
jgi:hypothetical protein